MILGSLLFRNQQAVGSSPTGGSNLFRCNGFRMIGNLSESENSDQQIKRMFSEREALFLNLIG